MDALDAFNLSAGEDERQILIHGHPPNRLWLRSYIRGRFGTIPASTKFQYALVYEYLGCEFGQGIVEVQFSSYFFNRVPKMHFLSNHKDALRHPTFLEFDQNECIGPVCDFFVDFLAGRIMDFLCLFCLPFTLELIFNDIVYLTLEAGITIPTKKTVFLPSNDGKLLLRSSYLNQTRVQEISVPIAFAFPYECGIDIDPDLCVRVIFGHGANCVTTWPS